jgi:hypothetical protein
VVQARTYSRVGRFWVVITQHIITFLVLTGSTILAATSNRRTLRRNAKTVPRLGISSQRASVAGCGWRCSWFADSCHPDDGGPKFIRNVGSDKSHTT